MKLDKEFKDKWVNALRSGDYEQNTEYGQLKYKNKYCCIGVYAVVNNIEISPDGRSMVINNELCSYNPLEDIIGRDNIRTLYTMNDTDEKSFMEISNWVEDNL